MIHNKNFAIPAKSLGYIIICAGITLVLVLGIISFHRYNEARKQDLISIQKRIDEQKAWGPVYVSLVKANEAKIVYVLPNPESIKLTRQELDKFQEAFRQTAGKNKMINVTLSPDVKTLEGTSGSLLYNGAMKGDLPSFRQFIIGLSALPYVENIDEINIKQFSDSMEFRMKIRVALAN